MSVFFQHSPRSRSTSVLFAAVAIVVAAVAVPAESARPEGAASVVPEEMLSLMRARVDPGVSAEELQRVRDTFGIEIEGIRLTSAGYAMDFRYKVVDAKKASVLHGVTVKPYVYHAPTKSRLTVPRSPKVGSMTQGTQEPVEGRTYYTMFVNPGRMVKSGERVSLVIEDLVVKDITVH